MKIIFHHFYMIFSCDKKTSVKAFAIALLVFLSFFLHPISERTAKVIFVFFSYFCFRCDWPISDILT